MPRFAKITAAEERARLRERMRQPALLRVRTIFVPHVRNDVPGRVCPCCGSEHAWGLGEQDDLEVLIAPRTQVRRNGWSILTPDGRDAFRDRADAAQPWGTEGALVWDVPIRFTCGEDQIAQIQDDDTMSILWSGGWRSMKSHTCAQWWGRGWVKYGAQGELFWLVGPQEITAFRLMERIFYGRGRSEDGSPKRSPPVLPSFDDPDTGEPRSMVAVGLPSKVGRRDPSFHFVDGAKAELRHTMTDAALEGDDVRRIMGDELVRWRSRSSYQICLGRVTQCGGQIGGATVPDEEGEWVYDEIVAPFEHGTGKGVKVYTMPTYELDERQELLPPGPSVKGNLWLGRPQAQRLRERCVDETMLLEKFCGEWSRGGMFAYLKHFDPGRHVVDAIGHEPTAWGFTHDVTRQACRALFKGKSRDYLGARDFNERPQTGLCAKLFTNDPRNQDAWCLAIVDEHLSTGDARRAAREFKRFQKGRYEGAALVGDRNGFWDGHRYGGRPSKTTDAWEFQSEGFLIRPPLYTPKKTGRRGKVTGGEPENPGVSDSKKLVRKLLGEDRILIDSKCIKLIAAMPRVPRGEKRKKDANTASDRQIFNFDDCLRYLTWALFHGEIGKKPQAKPRVRGAPRLGA